MSGLWSSPSSKSHRPSLPGQNLTPGGTRAHGLRRPASSVSLRSSYGASAATTSFSTPTRQVSRTSSPLYAHHSLSTAALPLGANTNTCTGNIKVSIKIKPPPNDNAATNHSNDKVWTVDADNSSISARDVGEFTFDNVLRGESNTHLYNVSVKGLVGQVMAGYNGTVFAYGMTGSGKTYSMQGSPTDPGIIPQSVASIFNHIKEHKESSFTVKVSYLEIYNEQLHDLLAPPGTQASEVKLRDDPQRGVKAVGLKEVTVTTPSALMNTIQSGNSLRRTEGTEFNSTSSRSHAVVQITIESQTNSPTGSSSAPLSRMSTLYLCDLAGSERAAQKVERRKEGAFINKSLLTLGTVIARLSMVSSANSSNLQASYTSGGGGGHIPYRDSKLTRLLQPALSGKSLVSVVCTVDLHNSANHTETTSTLRFAARAKNIVVSAKRAEGPADPNSKLIENLRAQIEMLKAENATLKETIRDASTSTSSNSPRSPGASNALLEAENQILHERVEHLTRLCDDDRLEEVIGLGIDDESLFSPMADTPTITRLRPHSSLSSCSSLGTTVDEEAEWGRKEAEYKSYIQQLESRLLTRDVKKFDLGTPSQPTSTEERLVDLAAEISKIRESNADKDRVIMSYRSGHHLQNDSLVSTPARKPLQFEPSPHSAAYSRYYNSPITLPTELSSFSPRGLPDTFLPSSLANINPAVLNAGTPNNKQPKRL